jgi:hypothetical protein
MSHLIQTEFGSHFQEWRSIMNAFSSLYLSFRANHYGGPPTTLKSWLVNAMKQLWRVADLTPVITFASGLMVGLLIPSEDWPAIITVIVAGVVLQTIVKTIDRKCANVQKSSIGNLWL